MTLDEAIAAIKALDQRVLQLEYRTSPGVAMGTLPRWCAQCGWEIDGDRHVSDMPNTAGWRDKRLLLPCAICGRDVA
jgi:hypothetical protein